MSSVNKALALFGKLKEKPYEFSLGELAQVVESSKSGVYKILSYMVQEGYVQQLPNKKYALGASVLALYAAYNKHSLNWSICQPVLEKLCGLTGETCTLARWENNFAHILYRARSSENLRVEGNVGRRLPLNASAHGKLLAAYQNEETVDAIIARRPLEKLCPNTITDVGLLKAEYADIRKKGVSISVEESTIGSVGIAAPVFDPDGKVCASLCVGTPSIRLTEAKRELVTKCVMQAAHELSVLLARPAASGE